MINPSARSVSDKLEMIDSSGVDAKVRDLLAAGIWKEHVDKQSGRKYFYCKSTKETTWDIRKVAAALLDEQEGETPQSSIIATPPQRIDTFQSGGSLRKQATSPKIGVAVRFDLLGPHITKPGDQSPYDRATIKLLMMANSEGEGLVVAPNVVPSTVDRCEKYLAISTTSSISCRWSVVTMFPSSGRLGITAADTETILAEGKYSLHVDRSSGVVWCALPSKPLLAQAAFRIVSVGCTVLPLCVELSADAPSLQPQGLVAVLEDSSTGSGRSLVQRLMGWVEAQGEKAVSDGDVSSSPQASTRGGAPGRSLPRPQCSGALSSLLLDAANALQKDSQSRSESSQSETRLLCLKGSGLHETWERRVDPIHLRQVYNKAFAGLAGNAQERPRRRSPFRGWVRGSVSNDLVDGIVAELRAAELVLDQEISDLRRTNRRADL